jgi:uncharacterized protein YegL
MAFNDFKAESPQNYEQKTICCFVVDVSISMKGEPIKELNQGLQDFYIEIKNDIATAARLEVAIVEFSDTVDAVLTPSLVENFTMPVLTTKGSTKLVDGVREAIILVKTRKAWYKQTGQKYLRPWIVLMTDGAPDPDQDINGLAVEIENGTKNKEFAFYPIGVLGADMDVLRTIAGYEQDKNKNWVKVQPAMLKGLNFGAFFKWLSASMAMVAGAKPGETLQFDDPSRWGTFDVK